MSATRFQIESRLIGDGHPCYIIAEMSGNHGKSFDQAVRIIHAAKTAGADAIKFQTYTADTLTIDSDREYFRVGPGTVWAGKNLHALYKEASTPWDWQPKLKTLAEELCLDCFSTPFDSSSVDFLESMGVPAYKIASFELVDHQLIAKVAETGKPTIISTGMASFSEIEEAVQVFRTAGGVELALLKCNSGYPAPVEEMNLRTIPHLAHAFNVPIGLSDHTLGISAAVTAVALGASIVEKHLTLSRTDGGPDSSFSLEPGEFGAMVAAVREAETALGNINYGTTETENASRKFRRSLFAVEEIRAGEYLTSRNVRSIRPSDGLAPCHYEAILGAKAKQNIARGTPLSWDLLEQVLDCHNG